MPERFNRNKNIEGSIFQCPQFRKLKKKIQKTYRIMSFKKLNPKPRMTLYRKLPFPL